ncbi:MAG: arylesterase [Achromobacter sp.]|jgi:acyl-CoA thioesterase-1
MRLFFRLLCRTSLSAVLLLCAYVPASAQTASTASGSRDAASVRNVLVVGDSLSAEYGLRRGSGWVPLMAQRMTEQYPNYRLINASISGDTTSGGVSRIGPLLEQHKPAIVIIELGGNDALRGLALDMTENNLTAMAEQARKAGARVMIVGMQIPPNYGRAYADRFQGLFATVAKAQNATFVPFLLEGMATRREWFQADGIHPNEAAQPTLRDNVWPVLEPMLNKQTG